MNDALRCTKHALHFFTKKGASSSRVCIPPLSPQGQHSRPLSLQQPDLPVPMQQEDQSDDIFNIANIHDDYREPIFKKIGLCDLISLSDTTKKFAIATRLAYASNFGDKRVIFFGFKRNGSIEIEGNDIYMKNLTLSLKLMRQFGDLIKKLRIDYWTIPTEEFKELDRYIDMYCTKSVLDLNIIIGYSSWSLNHFSKPFTKARKIVLNAMLCHSSWTDVNEIFPNLSDLKLFAIKGNEVMSANIPNLNSFDVDVDNVQDLRTWLQKNPQLRTLRVTGKVLEFEILEIICRFPQLEHFDLLVCTVKFPVSYAGSQSIDFKHMKKFEVNSQCLKQLINKNVSMSFDQLEELKIFNAFDTKFIDFVRKYPSITKFTTGVGPTKVDEIVGLARALVSVVEISIGSTTISMDNAIEFVNKCKFLKKFAFKMVKNVDEIEYESEDESECRRVLQSALYRVQNTLQKRVVKKWLVSVQHADLFGFSVKLERS